MLWRIKQCTPLFSLQSQTTDSEKKKNKSNFRVSNLNKELHQHAIEFKL